MSLQIEEENQFPPLRKEPYNEIAKKAPRNEGSTGIRKNRKRATLGIKKDSGFMAADTDIVVFGVSMHKQLSIIQKSKTYMQLTKWDQARSLSFKLTIKSKDFEKAWSSSSWPYIIGVRIFQRFKGNSSSREVQTPKTGSITNKNGLT